MVRLPFRNTMPFTAAVAQRLQKPERPSLAHAAQSSLAGRGVFFWYQATRLAKASASCRYRIGHFAEQLRGVTTIIDAAPSPEHFRAAETLIVVRPYLDDRAKKLLDACRRRSVRLIADFDDLLFEGPPEQAPAVLNGLLSAHEWAERTARYRDGLAQFSAFTAATTPLVERLQSQNPQAKVFHVPNALSPAWLAQGRALYPSFRPGAAKRIRYLPGSPSHDADFATIRAPLLRFLSEFPEVHLEIVGPLTLPAGDWPRERVRQLPKVPYAELPRLLSSSWVTLAPLAPGAFTASKSAIKFLESAAFGTPCIASPNADLERHRDGGVVLAQSEDDWYHALVRLLDPEHRTRLGSQGRAYVDERATARAGVRALLKALEALNALQS